MPTSSRLPSIRPTTRRERIKRNETTIHKDDIFLKKNSPTKFEFNSGVAEVFDDMLERSVPLYRECQDLTVNWCKRLAIPDRCVYDLGCSTGSLLLLLGESIPTISRVSLIVMNYTLQFIPVENRGSLLKKIYESLIPGGGFILNEKVLSENELLGETFVEMHHDFKKGHGYSKMEISKKRGALENVLVPLKLSKTMTLVREAGFTAVDIFFKWNNFAGLIALK